MITVTPDVIDPNGKATISHDGDAPKTVTITSQSGATATIVVPAGGSVKWAPPAGWTQARFNTPGCPEVARYISRSASA
ncbi:MAG: hypothetical protein AB8H80_14540 [Planctomycetota bacterium]